MKLDKLFQSLLLTSAIALLFCTPAKGEEVGEDIPEANKNISQLSEAIPITGVVTNPTDRGVEIILQTTQGKVLQPVTLALGKTYIANIPNAVLALPQGKEFRSDNPASGITRVSVTQATANSIRVTVTGETALPQVQLYDSPNEGLIFSLTPGTSAAQAPPPAEGETQQKKPSIEDDEQIEIVVTGEQEGYRVPDASTATKTDTPLRDIPQSIQVVPQEVIEDRQPRNLVDALRSVPGISQANQSSTSIYEDPRIRGFEATTDVLRDGTRSPYATFNSFDSATVERIEVLRGPASVLYGQGSLGGIINIISKQPLSEPYYSVEASAGSFDFYRGAIDFSGPLNDERTLLYRFNLAARTTESFVDFFGS